MTPAKKTTSARKITRCSWPADDALMIEYHDREWGQPVHEDHKHFEFLVLDGAQAGLSWRTVLYKREGYRQLFAEFDPAKVARFTEKRIARLLENPAIIRNRQKVNSAVKNAKAFLLVQKEFGSFDRYIWRFVNGAPVVNRWKKDCEIPTQTVEAEAMSKDMKSRGFSFCGPTICYAYMQAAGMVNDHLITCYRHQELTGKKSR